VENHPFNVYKQLLVLFSEDTQSSQNKPINPKSTSPVDLKVLISRLLRAFYNLLDLKNSIIVDIKFLTMLKNLLEKMVGLPGSSIFEMVSLKLLMSIS
jgi:hypothetical protein